MRLGLQHFFRTGVALALISHIALLGGALALSACSQKGEAPPPPPELVHLGLTKVPEAELANEGLQSWRSFVSLKTTFLRDEFGTLPQMPVSAARPPVSFETVSTRLRTYFEPFGFSPCKAELGASPEGTVEYAYCLEDKVFYLGMLAPDSNGLVPVLLLTNLPRQ